VPGGNAVKSALRSTSVPSGIKLQVTTAQDPKLESPHLGFPSYNKNAPAVSDKRNNKTTVHTALNIFENCNDMLASCSRQLAMKFQYSVMKVGFMDVSTNVVFI
jgi:hypothetical protein